MLPEVKLGRLPNHQSLDAANGSSGAGHGTMGLVAALMGFGSGLMFSCYHLIPSIWQGNVYFMLLYIGHM